MQILGADAVFELMSVNPNFLNEGKCCFAPPEVINVVDSDNGMHCLELLFSTRPTKAPSGLNRFLDARQRNC